MVAPHVASQLTRSLVRIPNSGAEKPHEVDLLDLSRVSPTAALVPVMQGLPPNMFTARRPSHSRSTTFSTDCGPVKPSKPTSSLSEPRPAVGNGLVHQDTAAVSASSVPLQAVQSLYGSMATSSVEGVSRAASRRGTLPPLWPAIGNVSLRTTPVPPTRATSGRKRLFPVAHEGSASSTTATSAKVPKTAASNSGRGERRAPSRRRVTKEQLLRDMDKLRSGYEALRTDYEALRSACEAYRNYYLSMVNQQRLSSMGSVPGVQVH